MRYALNGPERGKLRRWRRGCYGLAPGWLTAQRRNPGPRRPPGRWGRPRPISMIASSRANASSWRRRSGVSAKQRQQAPRRASRGVQSALEEFRHHVFAEHQIGEDRRVGSVISRRADQLLQQRNRRPRPSARPRAPVRASPCRTAAAPRAPCGTPRISRPRSTTMRGRTARLRSPRRTASARCGTVGTTTSSAPTRSRDQRDGLAEHARQAADLAAPAARQHQQHRRIGQRAGAPPRRSDAIRATLLASGWPT